MLRKQTAILTGLMAIVLILTGSTVRGTGSPAALAVLSPLIIPALFTLYLIGILVYCRTIIEALAAFLVSGPRNGGRHTPALLATILGWAIILGIAGLILYYRTGLVQLLLGSLQQAGVLLSTFGGLVQTAQQQTPSSPTASNMIMSFYTIIVFGAISLVSFSLLLAALYKAYNDARSLPLGAPESPRKEVLKAVQEALTNLQGSERFHEVILKCYKNMCLILSDRGYVIGAAQTAREFAESLSSKLDLGAESVSGLTLLFEEARYSNHPITEKEREIALVHLNSLELVLKEIEEKP
jgi:hypothetical protein